ncbi:MAG: DUF5654 family protein [Thermoplasmata archaeon]
MGDKPEKVTASEIKKTIASSLGAAFGIVIGMVWTQVVLGAFATAGVNLSAGAMQGNWVGLIMFVVTAIIVTFICVLAIVYIGRWGAKSEEKK